MPCVGGAAWSSLGESPALASGTTISPSSGRSRTPSGVNAVPGTMFERYDIESQGDLDRTDEPRRETKQFAVPE